MFWYPVAVLGNLHLSWQECSFFVPKSYCFGAVVNPVLPPIFFWPFLCGSAIPCSGRGEERGFQEEGPEPGLFTSSKSVGGRGKIKQSGRQWNLEESSIQNRTNILPSLRILGALNARKDHRPTINPSPFQSPPLRKWMQLYR